MLARTFAILVLVGLPLCGCVIVDVGVTNPLPGLTSVAVVPFYNQSHERAVDGRRFAFAYFAELQKVPGFKVVPVGVTEQAIIDHDLQMDSPQDALRLARILNVDAVVIGSVTDYDPYYPPRIGMQVSWYSPDPWTFAPGVQTDPYARRRLKHFYKQNKQPPDDNIVGETQGLNRLRKFGRVTGLSHITRLRFKLRDRLQELELGEKLHSAAEHVSAMPGALIERAEGLAPARHPVDDDMPVPELERGGPEISAPIVVEEFVMPIEAPSPPLDDEPTVEQPLWTPRTDEERNPGEELAPPPEIRGQSPNWEERELDKAPFMSVTEGGEGGITGQPMDSEPSQAGAAEQSAPVEPVLPPMPEQANSADGSAPPMPAGGVREQSGVRSLESGVPSPWPRTTHHGPLTADNLALPLHPPPAFDPLEPLMSYTRMFDGTDAELVAELRDYVELNGDLRSGSWRAYLHRSDDFIRFTTHRMIVEMLTLHGGEGKRRVVFKLRKHK